MPAYLLDANISWRVCKFLQDDIGAVVHVHQIGLPWDAPDDIIYAYAKSHELTIITKDNDFVNIALLRGFPPKVVLLRTFRDKPSDLANLLLNHKEDIAEFIADKTRGLLYISDLGVKY